MQSRVHECVAAIEALPEEDCKRLRVLMHRGDVLNNWLVVLLDAPEPVYPERRQEQLELLRAERDAAWGEARRLEISLKLCRSSEDAPAHDLKRGGRWTWIHTCGGC
jgi:hypothetical protein